MAQKCASVAPVFLYVKPEARRSRQKCGSSCVPPQQRSVCVCVRARYPSQVVRGFSVCVCGIHLEQGRVLVLLYPSKADNPPPPPRTCSKANCSYTDVTVTDRHQSHFINKR